MIDRWKLKAGMLSLLILMLTTFTGCNEERGDRDSRGRPRLRPNERYVEDLPRSTSEPLPSTPSIPVPSSAPVVVADGVSPMNPECDNRGLIFACSNYDGRGDLSSPVKQAEKQYKSWVRKGMKPANIRVIFDREATAANWRTHMDWLHADEKIGDVRARFQSHHGAQWRGGNESDGVDEIYFVYGSHTWDPKDFVRDDEEYERASRTLQTCQHYVRIDTCYSGGMAKTIIPHGKPQVKEKKIIPPPAIAARIAAGKPNNVKLKLLDLTNFTYEFACAENETSLSIGGPDPYDLFTKFRIQLDEEFPNRYCETNMRAVYALMLKDGFGQQHPTFSGDCKRIYLSPNTKVKHAPKGRKSDAEDLHDLKPPSKQARHDPEDSERARLLFAEYEKRAEAQAYTAGTVILAQPTNDTTPAIDPLLREKLITATPFPDPAKPKAQIKKEPLCKDGKCKILYPGDAEYKAEGVIYYSEPVIYTRASCDTGRCGSSSWRAPRSTRTKPGQVAPW